VRNALSDKALALPQRGMSPHGRRLFSLNAACARPLRGGLPARPAGLLADLNAG